MSVEGKLHNSKWAKMNNCSADTALRDITDLVRRGALVKDSGGDCKTSYALNDLVRMYADN